MKASALADKQMADAKAVAAKSADAKPAAKPKAGKAAAPAKIGGGSTVKVTAGKYKGKSGTVSQIVPGNPSLGTSDLCVVKLGGTDFPVISIDDLVLTN